MAEENESKEQLAQLEKLDVDSAEFNQLFAGFQRAVLAHAEAEEQDEFPLLQEGADSEQLHRLERALEAAEKTAPTHPHPSAKTTTMNYVAGPFAAMVDRARDAINKIT